MPKPQTRAQQDLRLAVINISALKSEDDKVKASYIRRVKQFPALVMTVGLAQAVAFSYEKAAKGNDLAKSHELMLKHVAAVLDVKDSDKIHEHIFSASTADYMQMTRRLLSAWSYYRRFAVSILDPEEKLKGDDEGI